MSTQVPGRRHRDCAWCHRRFTILHDTEVYCGRRCSRYAKAAREALPSEPTP